MKPLSEVWPDYRTAPFNFDSKPFAVRFAIGLRLASQNAAGRGNRALKRILALFPARNLP